MHNEHLMIVHTSLSPNRVSDQTNPATTSPAKNTSLLTSCIHLYSTPSISKVTKELCFLLLRLIFLLYLRLLQIQCKNQNQAQLLNNRPNLTKPNTQTLNNTMSDNNNSAQQPKQGGGLFGGISNAAGGLASGVGGIASGSFHISNLQQ
jgi:hypothetical protein